MKLAKPPNTSPLIQGGQGGLKDAKYVVPVVKMIKF